MSTEPVTDKPLTKEEQVREAQRLARLSLREIARTYSVSLPDPPPTRRSRSRAK